MSPFVVALAVVLATSTTAAARGADDEADSWIEIPARCNALAAVPETAPTFWETRVALGTCMLDLDIQTRVTDEDSLDQAMRAMADRAMPALFVYEDVVANGPQPVRYRAAYHIALVMTAMITRVRAALPRDCPAALRAGLEDRLVDSVRALRVVLESIDAIAAEEPPTVADPVNRAIAKAVHAQVQTWR